MKLTCIYCRYRSSQTPCCTPVALCNLHHLKIIYMQNKTHQAATIPKSTQMDRDLRDYRFLSFQNTQAQPVNDALSDRLLKLSNDHGFTAVASLMGYKHINHMTDLYWSTTCVHVYTTQKRNQLHARDTQQNHERWSLGVKKSNVAYCIIITKIVRTTLSH